jgi:hypothetical protein
MSLSRWHPQLRRAAPATSLVLELYCRPPHQAVSVGEGPDGASAGLAVACYASREVVGPAGFASSISSAPFAAPWLSGEPFGFPFYVSKLCLVHFRVVSCSWRITYGYHDGLRT